MTFDYARTITIPLTLGQQAIISEPDLSLIAPHSWHARPRRDRKGFYAVNNSGIRMHRLLLGVWDKRIVDHINGDGLDNRRENLRAGTQAQNCINRRQTPGDLPRGVSQKGRKYRAQIKQAGRYVSLGYFDTPEAAHAAYMTAAIRLHGDWMPLPAPPALLDALEGRG